MTRGGERNQARSVDRSRPKPPPPPPGAFPEPCLTTRLHSAVDLASYRNVPGHGVYIVPNAYAPSQQFQAQAQAQVGHARHGLGLPPPLPPRPTPPIQPPTLPTDYASIPRQQGTGYINSHVNDKRPSFPAFPHVHRDPDQTPPYGWNGPPGRPEPPHYLPSPPPPPPVPNQSLITSGLPPYGRSSSRESCFVHPHTSPPPQLPTPSHVGPSFTSGPHQAYGYPVPQPHASASQPYPSRVGRKKAFLVGIDYSKHQDRRLRLKWGVYDAKEMERFLQEHHGFHPDNTRILTDDQRKSLPTAANIKAGMRWLVDGAQPGDCLFFYFSGHATQIEDQDGDELDGLDECMCAMDYDDRTTPPRGIIVDDTIHDIMVKPLPKGCRLTAVLDCCNSGTLLDLPHVYDSNGVVEQNRPDTIWQKQSDADVISLSACQDSSKAYEVRGGGALREAFIEYMKRFGNRGTHLQAIRSLHAHMAANRLSQFPQLSSSHWIDTDQQFIITG